MCFNHGMAPLQASGIQRTVGDTAGADNKSAQKNTQSFQR